jgi:hypothetical protein
MNMANSEKILIQDGDTVIELTGEAKAKFIVEQEKLNKEYLIFKEHQLAKESARESAITKLKALGLTKEEIEAII